MDHRRLLTAFAALRGSLVAAQDGSAFAALPACATASALVLMDGTGKAALLEPEMDPMSNLAKSQMTGMKPRLAGGSAGTVRCKARGPIKFVADLSEAERRSG